MAKQNLNVAVLGAALLMAQGWQARAQGIPEPSVILYGVVTDPSNGGAVVTNGALTWVFRPADGSAAITLSASLTNLNNSFSYVLRVPCESLVSGFLLSTGVLELATSPTTYYRTNVTVQGIPATFVQPSQTNLTLFPGDRGHIERVDLTANVSSIGLLPNSWQLQYFGTLGVNPYADPDHDGMNNYQEYLAGTSPIDPKDVFKITHVQPDPSGAYVQWSSASGKYYTVQRASALLQGFSNVQIHIPATAPLNTFHDTSGAAGGPVYYRIQVE